MDATCAIQASIHVFSLVRKYVSRILGTYHFRLSAFSLFEPFPNGFKSLLHITTAMEEPDCQLTSAGSAQLSLLPALHLRHTPGFQ